MSQLQSDFSGEPRDPFSAWEGYKKQLYATAWNGYREAGAPFGKTDVGMLIWFIYNQDTRPN